MKIFLSVLAALLLAPILFPFFIVTLGKVAGDLSSIGPIGLVALGVLIVAARWLWKPEAQRKSAQR
jgi:hypothetical protein